MGYRHYFYLVKKSDVEKCNNIVFDELKRQYGDADGYIDFGEVFPRTEVFEFGKLYYEDTAERIYNTGEPLFGDKDCQEYFEDYYPFVVGKEGLLEAIKIYKEKVINAYQSLLGDGQEVQYPLGITMTEDISEHDKMKNFVKSRLLWIQKYHFEDINETNKYKVSKSYIYEHAIFNLIHLLKVIDWDNETILFYGW